MGKNKNNVGKNGGKAKPGSKRRDNMDECELTDREGDKSDGLNAGNRGEQKRKRQGLIKGKRRRVR